MIRANARGLDASLTREFGSVNYGSTGLETYVGLLKNEEAVAQNTARFLVELATNPTAVDLAVRKVWPRRQPENSTVAAAPGGIPPLNLSLTATENGFAKRSPKFVLAASSGQLRAQAEALLKNPNVPAARKQVVESYLAVMDQHGISLEHGDPDFMALVMRLGRIY